MDLLLKKWFLSFNSEKFDAVHPSQRPENDSESFQQMLGPDWRKPSNQCVAEFRKCISLIQWDAAIRVVFSLLDHHD
jgi:hypothetical protein